MFHIPKKLIIITLTEKLEMKTTVNLIPCQNFFFSKSLITFFNIKPKSMNNPMPKIIHKKLKMKMFVGLKSFSVKSLTTPKKPLTLISTGIGTDNSSQPLVPPLTLTPKKYLPLGVPKGTLMNTGTFSSFLLLGSRINCSVFTLTQFLGSVVL